MAFATVVDVPKLETAADAKIIGLHGVIQPKEIIESGAAIVVDNPGPEIVRDKHEKVATINANDVTLNPARRAASQALIQPGLSTIRRTGVGAGSGTYANRAQVMTTVIADVQRLDATLLTVAMADIGGVDYDIIVVVVDAGGVTIPSVLPGYRIDITGKIATDFDVALVDQEGNAITVVPTIEQPTDVTGVVLTASPLGTRSGTHALAYTAVGDLLGWSGGATQDVGAGGVFTLVGASALNEVVATVTAGSLPVGDETDAALVYEGNPAFIFIAIRST